MLCNEHLGKTSKAVLSANEKSTDQEKEWT